MSEFRKKVLEGLFLVMLCCCPIIVLTGCGADSCIRCTACGDDDTRFFVYASGTDNQGVSYKSCVGPAGILGCGLNTKCWPTECVSVEQNADSNKVSGCVVYYNEMGCISKTGVKSNGKYSDDATCLGITCAGTKYKEVVAETTKATETNTCLGVSCGGEESVEPYNYNNSMPRSFPNGCWTND